MGIVIVLIIYLAILFAVIGGTWKIFEKAGKPGWASIVPVYNIIVMLEIVDRPLWWIILPIVPAIVIPLELAKRFGKSTGFGVGLLLLPIIFVPMLGFGDAEFLGGEKDELDHMID